jgi:hypothetical protein
MGLPLKYNPAVTTKHALDLAGTDISLDLFDRRTYVRMYLEWLGCHHDASSIDVAAQMRERQSFA